MSSDQFVLHYDRTGRFLWVQVPSSFDHRSDWDLALSLVVTRDSPAVQQRLKAG